MGATSILNTAACPKKQFFSIPLSISSVKKYATRLHIVITTLFMKGRFMAILITNLVRKFRISSVKY